MPLKYLFIYITLSSQSYWAIPETVLLLSKRAIKRKATEVGIRSCHPQRRGTHSHGKDELHFGLQLQSKMEAKLMDSGNLL